MPKLSYEDLYQLATQDFSRWQGKAVKTRILIGGNGNDWCGWIKLSGKAEVMIDDDPAASCDTKEYASEGGLLETYYPLKNEVHLLDDLPGVPGDAIGHEVDGPTYYTDGRVVYPDWWPASKDS